MAEVAETQNISRAAERLGITQPSLSSAIQRLEEVLGVKLLLRSRAGAQLTPAGKEFLKHSRGLLLHWDQIKSEVSKRQSDIAGQYRIGCHPSVALYSLPYFLPQLMQDYPQLEIQLLHDLSRRITEQVISFEIDFGIVVNPVRHPDLVLKELCQDTVSFWVAQRPSITQKLNSPKAVLVCEPSLIQTQKLLNDLNRKKISFRRVIHSSHLEVIADLTRAGVGVGLLPQRVATRNVGMGLKLLQGSLPVFRDHIYLVYRADLQKTQAAKVIISAIERGVK